MFNLMPIYHCGIHNCHQKTLYFYHCACVCERTTQSWVYTGVLFNNRSLTRKYGQANRQRKSWLGLTVDTLTWSTLQSHGVIIPVKRQPKAYFQALYQELILGVGGDINARSSYVTNLDSSAENFTPSPVQGYINTRGVTVNRPDQHKWGKQACEHGY